MWIWVLEGRRLWEWWYCFLRSVCFGSFGVYLWWICCAMNSPRVSMSQYGWNRSCRRRMSNLSKDSHVRRVPSKRRFTMWTSKWFLIRIYCQNRRGFGLTTPFMARQMSWSPESTRRQLSLSLLRMESYEALQLGQMYFLAVDFSEIVSATIVCLSRPSFLSPFDLLFFWSSFFCLTRPCLSPLEIISRKHRKRINPGNLRWIGETVLGLAIIMCVFGESVEC